MKYSLTRLLLEDISPRNSNNVAGDPGKEGSKGIGFLNSYNILKFAADKAKEKLAAAAMSELYRRCDRDAKKIIDEARQNAKIRDNEILLILDDVTLEEQIVDDMTSTRLSEDEKKNLAYCLRYFEDPYARPLKLKIGPSGGQSGDEFKAELRQGVRELKIGAAIKGIDNWENQLNASNAALRRVIGRKANEKALEAAQKLFGTQGESFRIDLAADPVIEPILSAAEEATYEFKSALGETKSTIFMKPTLRIVPNPTNGTLTYASCGSRPGSMSEALNRSRVRTVVQRDVSRPLGRPTRNKREPAGILRQQTSADDESLSADQEAAAGPEVLDLQEALDQLKSRQPEIADIISSLYTRPGITPASIIGAFAARKEIKPSLNLLTYQFPGERGLGSSTQITTQSSVKDLARVAAGVVPMFAAGYRTSQVPINALELVGKALNVTDAQAKDPMPLYSAIDRQKDLFVRSEDARLALLYTIGVAVEYAMGKSGSDIGSERVTLGSSGLGTFIDNAYDSVLGFHHASTIAGKEGGIEVLPGQEPSNLNFFRKIMRNARGLPAGGNRITTMGVPDPYDPTEVGGEDDMVTLTPSEEGAALAKNKKIADDAIKRLIKSLSSSLPKSFARAARIIGSVKDVQASGTAGPASTLTMISFCNAVANIADTNTVACEGPVLMGYTSDAILMSQKVDGETVWARLCKLSGAKFIDNDGVKVANIASPKFDASKAYLAWKGAMTESNKAKSILGIRSLFMSDFVSPLARVIVHAIRGYESRGLLTSEGADELRKSLITAYNKAKDAVSNLSINASSAVRFTALSSGRLAAGNVRTPQVSANLGPMGPQYKLLSQNNPLKAPDSLDITLVAADDAPRVVDFDKLSFDSSQPESAGSSGSGGGSEPGTPPPGPPPGPAPAPAAAAAAPAPAALPATLTFSADDNVIIPLDELEKIKVTVKFTAKLQKNEAYSESYSGTMSGGLVQQAAMRNSLKDVRATLIGWPESGKTTTNTLEAFAQNFRDKLKRETALTSGARVESIDVQVSSNEQSQTPESEDPAFIAHADEIGFDA